MTPESQNVEWKRSWRDEYLAWICGFANAQGGILEIGKDDNGDVVGVRKVPSSACAFPSRRRISQRLAAASGSTDRGTTPITTPTTPITTPIITPKTGPIPVANRIRRVSSSRAGHWEVL